MKLTCLPFVKTFLGNNLTFFFFFFFFPLSPIMTSLAESVGLLCHLCILVVCYGSMIAFNITRILI